MAQRKRSILRTASSTTQRHRSLIIPVKTGRKFERFGKSDAHFLEDGDRYAGARRHLSLIIPVKTGRKLERFGKSFWGTVR